MMGRVSARTLNKVIYLKEQGDHERPPVLNDLARGVLERCRMRLRPATTLGREIDRRFGRERAVVAADAGS
jgi:hypothetical protein